MNEKQIRKDFEEWMGDGGQSPRAIERNSKGDYILMQAAHAWEVWNAAHTHYAKSAAPVVPPEPFGYFKCDAYGWMDCTETDEGARPLYEAPQPRADALDTERLDFLTRKIDGASFRKIGVEWAEHADARRAIDAAIAAARAKP